MLIDLHVHSSHTPDVSFSTADLVARARERGLDGFCLTDVHTLAGGREAKELAAAEDIVVLVGFEAQTECGHFLVFCPDPESLPEPSTWVPADEHGRLDYRSLVKAVQERGGILVVAHPYDREIDESPGDSMMRIEGVSAIEVLNANRHHLVNELAEEAAAGAGLPGVGGSDVRKSLDKMGRFATLVRGPVQTEADLIERVRSFDVWPVSIGQSAFPAAERRPARSRERPSRGPRRDDQGRSRPRTNRSDGRRSSSSGDSRQGDRKPRRPRSERSRPPKGK